MERALLVDPLDVGMNMNLGDHLMLARSFDEAAEAYRQALSLNSGHRPTRLRLAWALAADNQAKAAVDLLNEIGPANPGDWQWLEYAAIVHGEQDPDTALEHYQALTAISESAFVSLWSLARAAAAAGQSEDAIRWLGKARDQGNLSFSYAAVTPVFVDLAEHPKFQELTRSLRSP
jgi:tetratricopeptide (TPR) repeat protein